MSIVSNVVLDINMLKKLIKIQNILLLIFTRFNFLSLEIIVHPREENYSAKEVNCYLVTLAINLYLV